MDIIYIDTKDDVEIIGMVEGDRLVELYIEEKEQKYLGNIYRGRVINVLPGMEAVFVDIGKGKNAYLHIKNVLPKDMKQDEPANIMDIIKSGEELIVQVIKEAFKDKGARLTTHITLPGKYIVLTPFSKRITISRKIVEKQEIERLKQLGEDIQLDDMGLIFRTKAEGIEREVLETEYQMLIDIFKKIEREKNYLPCPKLIYKEIDLLHQIIRDAFNSGIDKIVLNDRNRHDTLVELKNMFFPYLDGKIQYDESFNILLNENTHAEIQKALDRVVTLNSGGYIVIDELEALTAIDVNTGKFVGDKNLEDTVVKTNLEAAEEIARQLRLRDIGGIIIIDFIDMKEQTDISLVLQELEHYLGFDKNRANIIGITKLGLVELTRKKTRGSLGLKFIKNCPHCNGKGKIIDRSALK